MTGQIDPGLLGAAVLVIIVFMVILLIVAIAAPTALANFSAPFVQIIVALTEALARRNEPPPADDKPDEPPK